MGTFHPTPPTLRKMVPWSLRHNLPVTRRARRLGLSGTCADIEQLLHNYVADDLILSAPSDHGAPKSGTGRGHRLGRQPPGEVALST